MGPASHAVAQDTAAPEEADPTVSGLLLDLDRFAAHDGPGIRTAVYLKGCPLSCAWCHSPESRAGRPEILYQDERCTGCWLCVDACPAGALTRGQGHAGPAASLDRAACDACGACAEVCYPGALRQAGRRITVGALVDDVARDLPFYASSGGGVTLSGGEPARQPAFSYHFLLACRHRGIHTALETTGHARPEVMARLARVADLLLYDLKLLDPGLHRRYTGVDNQRLRDNLAELATWHADIQVRVPCIPRVNDAPEQLRETARFVARIGLRRLALLPYNGAAAAKYEWLDRPYPLAGRETQSEQDMEVLAAVCRAEGLDVQIGG